MQIDNTQTQRKVLLVLTREDELQAFSDLLKDMSLLSVSTGSGTEALQLLEDDDIVLTIMDVRLPDMHGWQFLAKINEIDELRSIPIVIVADQREINTPVARVEYFLRPVSIARLRLFISSTVDAPPTETMTDD